MLARDVHEFRQAGAAADKKTLDSQAILARIKEIEAEWREKYPGMDMISFGPTLCYPHSPDEKVNIASVEKFWKFLTTTLENIPVK